MAVQHVSMVRDRAIHSITTNLSTIKLSTEKSSVEKKISTKMNSENSKKGVTLVELLVVLAIITVLLGLLLPAVQAVRRAAQETVCKNNLHQLNIAVANYVGIYKHSPGGNSEGVVSGWAIELLPFIEQGNLHSRIEGKATEQLPEDLRRRPIIFRCPIRQSYESVWSEFDPAHYVLVPLNNNRKRDLSVWIADAPLDLNVPWTDSPVISPSELRNSEGPHFKGFYVSGNSQGVQLMIHGEFQYD